jgi:hypothetical protein
MEMYKLSRTTSWKCTSCLGPIHGHVQVVYVTSLIRWTCYVTSEMSAQIQECISCIHKNNIRLVCFDFDQTAYRGHTGGALYLSLEDVIPTLHKMASDLSQDFLDLVCALHKENVHVAIVTFGDAIDNAISLENNRIMIGGELLIRPVLDMGLGRQTKDDIPIYALNPDWRNQQGGSIEFPNSKKWHLGQAMEHFTIHELGEVLLIDDSFHNISEAANDGFRTVLASSETAFKVSQVKEQLVIRKTLSA